MQSNLTASPDADLFLMNQNVLTSSIFGVLHCQKIMSTMSGFTD